MKSPLNGRAGLAGAITYRAVLMVALAGLAWFGRDYADKQAQATDALVRAVERLDDSIDANSRGMIRLQSEVIGMRDVANEQFRARDQKDAEQDRRLDGHDLSINELRRSLSLSGR